MTKLSIGTTSYIKSVFSYFDIAYPKDTQIFLAVQESQAISKQITSK